ncbi:MAG: serpin family protein [Armatimonadetes bacterium]|nr:serpin family protein [Armatimonadota bacterium]
MKLSSALVFFLVFLGVCAFVVFLILGGFGQGMLGRHDKFVEQRSGTSVEKAVAALRPEDTSRLENASFALKVATAAKLGDDGKNGCLSPYGVQIPLLMFLNGAQSRTFETLSAVLGSTDPTTEKHNAAQSKLLDVFASQPQAKVRVANALWAVQPVRFKKLFQDDMARVYDAEVKKLGSAGEGALKQVNDWVDQRTDGKIKRLFDDLSPEVELVMVDVITLEAEWGRSFEPASEKPFHTPRGIVRALTMRDPSREFRTVSEGGVTAATLAYGGSTLEATFLLPDKGAAPAGSAAFWKGLGNGRLGRLVKGNVVQGDFQFPKFSFKTDQDMRPVMKAIGAGGLFERGNDFSLLMHDSTFDRLSQFVQKTVVDFDEQGTRAEAATTADAVKSEEHEGSFIVDRPFAFMIRETTSGCVLFVGVVNDPTASS